MSTSRPVTEVGDLLGFMRPGSVCAGTGGRSIDGRVLLVEDIQVNAVNLEARSNNCARVRALRQSKIPRNLQNGAQKTGLNAISLFKTNNLAWDKMLTSTAYILAYFVSCRNMVYE